MNFSPESISAAARFVTACYANKPAADSEWLSAWRHAEDECWIDPRELDELRRIVIDKMPYCVSIARYSKGNFLVRCPSPDNYKTRASRLIGDALKCRWTNREGGYVASPSKLRRFEKLYADGWDACAITGRLRSPIVEAPAASEVANG